jgi:hypothetical protein
MDGIYQSHEHEKTKNHAADHGHRPTHGQTPIGQEIAIRTHMPHVPKYKQQNAVDKQIGD